MKLYQINIYNHLDTSTEIGIRIFSFEVQATKKLLMSRNHLYQKVDLDCIVEYTTIKDTYTVITLDKNKIPEHIQKLKTLCINELKTKIERIDTAMTFFNNYKYNKNKIEEV
jgi:hypothetical protein